MFDTDIMKNLSDAESLDGEVMQKLSLTPAEKAQETRRRNKEARRKKSISYYEMRDKLKQACMDILDDAEATNRDKIEAAKILHECLKGW